MIISALAKFYSALAVISSLWAVASSLTCMIDPAARTHFDRKIQDFVIVVLQDPSFYLASTSFHHRHRSSSHLRHHQYLLVNKTINI
ncbi:hypothetical protein O181_036117 [Austropuccinia psidii MF-1]|uniref:Secreted protein n=1 Tax=Austropuccinia psidii MF-1 TaxID=1389203 RepID=A0A9Q3D6H7_9BASI|nr:hypothetical protein [Austropuccinia psidii MF-1]